MTHTLSRFVRPTAAIALTLGASIAFAHPGHPGHTAEGSLLAGFLHPLTGADHLLAMVAVGVWSALASRSVRDALWAPIAFVSLMVIGALLGAGGVALPMAEPMIAASGMNLQVFTTGRGTPYGLAMAPVIKVSTRKALSERWHDLIDLDAGRIATGEASIADIGWELFHLILDVASGRKQVCADKLGLHNALALFNPAPVT